MATVSKFYLHDAATTNTGTMPTGAFLGTADQSGDATGGRTARTADGNIGSSQTSSLVTATANQTGQKWGHRRFVSPPLAAQTIPASQQTNWVFSCAWDESNLNHNATPQVVAYAWTPSTGTQSGSAQWTSNGTEPTLAATEQAQTFASANGVALSDLVFNAGDILVIEVWTSFTQSMSVAYTEDFYYDGTTEGSATSCATYLAPPSALTLLSGNPRNPAINLNDPAFL